MRERIFEIIEVGKKDDIASKIYDVFMIIVVILSVVPLLVKNDGPEMIMLDRFCIVIFIIDYLLRLWTADLKLKGKKYPFLRYPFTFMAIIDLLSILPSVLEMHEVVKAFRLVKIAPLLRGLQVFRVFRTLRYSKSVGIFIQVVKDTRDSLLVIVTLAITYIFISALIVFNVEPQTFDSFFDAVYWATVSLTTVGYGDIYPVTTVGRIVSMVSSLFGIAVVAMPAGVITAGYLEEIRKLDIKEEEKEKQKEEQEK